MDVITRLHDCQWSIREIAERAGLDWRQVDALVTRAMPGDDAAVPPEIVVALDQVLRRSRRAPAVHVQGGKPLVGLRRDLPVVIVGSTPARIVAWLATHDHATSAQLAAAVPVAARNPVCAMASVLSRMLRDSDLLVREIDEVPSRYRLSPQGWRVADALTRWAP